jgi:L-alanine-DL-glutamate epimerase-like enolase superfamily enzyme
MKRAALSLEIVELKIPFKQNFKHNAAERNVTQSVIVVARSIDLVGYGESCPREYVTGESIQSVFTFFSEVKNSIIDLVYDLNTLKYFAESNKDNIQNNLSAWCAVELALLDLFAKQQGCTVEALLQVPELSDQFSYTAVLGDSGLDAFNKMAGQYVKMGFTDFKIKISGDITTDLPKMLSLKQLSSGGCAIRLDANNLWHNENEVINYIKSIPLTLTGLEEPLVGKDIGKLAKLAKQINTPIILDESFVHIDQFDQIKENERHLIINLRISKMGGLLNSLNIVKKAILSNIGLIIGAQVGETSILTRAALTVAEYAKNHCFAMEGGFGTLLLEHDIVEKPLMFSYGGKLDITTSLNQELHGFQLAIDETLF